jgi:hypothetical protein
MRRLVIGVVLFVAAEAAALACSCVAPGTAAESRAAAREALSGAVAIVEADVLSAYAFGGAGERVRVRATLWGKAPREFRIARGRHASSASCDLLLPSGQRRILMLRPAASGWFGARRYTIQSLCSDYLFNDRRFLPLTLQEARRR